MHNFKELKVWQKARKLVKVIYDASAEFPNEEKFGLTSQMRRCAISIPSNIAEGSGRRTNKDFSHFLDIALGSTFELETQINLCLDLNFIQSEMECKMIENVSEIQKMIISLQRKLF